MAPTLHRAKNLRVVIYPKDHDSPHVLGPDMKAKFLLDSLECVYSRDFSEKALRLVRDYLNGKKAFLLEAWREYQE